MMTVALPKIVIKNQFSMLSGVLILPSITVGLRSDVGAESVVTKDCSEASILMGKPAFKRGMRSARQEK
jgi:acetyltransferase-like isoleucine patch superfamily enzyme